MADIHFRRITRKVITEVVVAVLSLRRMVNLTTRCIFWSNGGSPSHTYRRAISRMTTTLRALSQLRHHTLSRLHKCPHRCTLVSSQASNRIATLVRRLISIIIDLHIPATWFVCPSKEWIVPFNVPRPLTTHVPYAVLQPNFV